MELSNFIGDFIAFVIVMLIGTAILKEMMDDDEKFIRETQKLAFISLIVTLITVGVIKLISLIV